MVSNEYKYSESSFYLSAKMEPGKLGKGLLRPEEGGQGQKIILLGLKYVVTLPFLISEWSGFLRSTLKIMTVFVMRFMKAGHPFS